MLCLRCGYCCVKYDVIIVDPKYIDDDLDFDNESIQEKLMHKTYNKWCPHLIEKNKSIFSCKIHNKPWYDLTPCFEFGQIESSSDTKCRMGDYILHKNKQLKNHIRSLKG